LQGGMKNHIGLACMIVQKFRLQYLLSTKQASIRGTPNLKPCIYSCNREGTYLPSWPLPAQSTYTSPVQRAGGCPQKPSTRRSSFSLISSGLCCTAKSSNGFKLSMFVPSLCAPSTSSSLLHASVQSTLRLGNLWLPWERENSLLFDCCAC
jgi:hypothetical protein